MLFCSHANQAGMEECRAGRRLTQANQPCANDPRTEPGTYSFIVPSEMCLHHFNWNNNKNPQRLQTLKCGLLRLPLMPPTLFLTYSNYFEAFFPSKLRKLSERQEAWAGLSVSLKDGQAEVRDPGPFKSLVSPLLQWLVATWAQQPHSSAQTKEVPFPFTVGRQMYWKRVCGIIVSDLSCQALNGVLLSSSCRGVRL